MEYMILHILQRRTLKLRDVGDVTTGCEHTSFPMHTASLGTAEAQNYGKAHQSPSIVSVPGGPRAKQNVFIVLIDSGERWRWRWRWR